MSKNRGVGRDEALSGGFNVRSRAWGPVVLLVVLTIPLASPSALGQGDGWPVLPDPSIEYTPGDLLVLDLGTPVPGQIMGQYVIIEVDDPYGDPLIISSSTVPSGGQNLTLSFTLPSDCEPGAYQVFLCHEGTDGEGELHVGSFTVTLAEESERGPMSILPIVGACLGLLALSVAGAVATGDA